MRWRLLAAFIGVTVMVLAAQDVPLAAHLRRVESERLVAQLERDAFILAGSSSTALANPATASAAALRSTLDLYHAEGDADVVVTDRFGVAVAGSDHAATEGEDYSNRPEIAAALTGTPASGRRDSRTLNEELLYVAVPVLDGAEVIGVVRITYPAADIDTRADAKVRGLLVVGLISLIGAGVAALFMSGTVTRPLRRLQRATERVAAGDFQTRAADEGPTEVRSLAASFNTMTEQIAQLVDQQRAFAADASHQLRTPLTALRLQLERGAELIDTDPDQARIRIEAAGEEAERLQHLIQALLLLARPNAVATDKVVVDVAAIVRERADIWRPLAAERGLELHLGQLPASFARVAAGSLEQIIDNYIDNAISIAPTGSLIEIVVARDAGARVEIHVLDRGPGMPEDHLAHAFDRFWRSTDARHEGTGLGLTIAQHLAVTSGAAVALSNRPEGGLDAMVSLTSAE